MPICGPTPPPPGEEAGWLGLCERLRAGGSRRQAIGVGGTIVDRIPKSCIEPTPTRLSGLVVPINPVISSLLNTDFLQRLSQVRDVSAPAEGVPLTHHSAPTYCESLPQLAPLPVPVVNLKSSHKVP